MSRPHLDQSNFTNNSVQTICSKYTTQHALPPGMQAANIEKGCTRNSTLRCCLFGWVLSSIKLTNQLNMSVKSVVDRPKTSTWPSHPSNQPHIYLNTLVDVSVYLEAKKSG